MNVVEINKEKFCAYEQVRRSGVTNMGDVSLVMDLSGLSEKECFDIMKNYSIYKKKYMSGNLETEVLINYLKDSCKEFINNQAQKKFDSECEPPQDLFNQEILIGDVKEQLIEKIHEEVEEWNWSFVRLLIKCIENIKANLINWEAIEEMVDEQKKKLFLDKEIND